jgi:hypothetical protein
MRASAQPRPKKTFLRIRAFLQLVKSFGCPILAAYLFLRLGWDSKEPFYSNRRNALLTRQEIGGFVFPPFPAKNAAKDGAS